MPAPPAAQCRWRRLTLPRFLPGNLSMSHNLTKSIQQDGGPTKRRETHGGESRQRNRLAGRDSGPGRSLERSLK